jgi:hypothetical protein
MNAYPTSPDFDLGDPGIRGEGGDPASSWTHGMDGIGAGVLQLDK